jgi:hypothetical protein
MNRRSRVLDSSAVQDPNTTTRRIDSKTTAVLLLPIFVPTAVAAFILILEITS